MRRILLGLLMLCVVYSSRGGVEGWQQLAVTLAVSTLPVHACMLLGRFISVCLTEWILQCGSCYSRLQFMPCRDMHIICNSHRVCGHSRGLCMHPSSKRFAGG